MKKHYFMFFIIICTILFTACENETDVEDPSFPNKNSKKVDGSNIEITIPSFFFAELEDKVTKADEKEKEVKEKEILDALKEDAQLNGIKLDGIRDVQKNKNNTYTLIMDEKVYREILEKALDELDGYINYAQDQVVVGVEYNESYDKFTFNVDREVFEDDHIEYDIDDISLYSIIYQLLKGVNLKTVDVKFIIKDKDTGEVFDKLKVDLEDVQSEF